MSDAVGQCIIVWLTLGLRRPFVLLGEVAPRTTSSRTSSGAALYHAGSCPLSSPSRRYIALSWLLRSTSSGGAPRRDAEFLVSANQFISVPQTRSLVQLPGEKLRLPTESNLAELDDTQFRKDANIGCWGRQGHLYVMQTAFEVPAF